MPSLGVASTTCLDEFRTGSAPLVLQSGPKTNDALLHEMKAIGAQIQRACAEEIRAQNEQVVKEIKRELRKVMQESLRQSQFAGVPLPTAPGACPVRLASQSAVLDWQERASGYSEGPGQGCGADAAQADAPLLPYQVPMPPPQPPVVEDCAAPWPAGLVERQKLARFAPSDVEGHADAGAGGERKASQPERAGSQTDVADAKIIGRQNQSMRRLSLGMHVKHKPSFQQKKSKPFYKRTAREILLSTHFDNFIGCLILANAATIGMQADYASRHMTDDYPMYFSIIERVFCVCFIMELCLRIYVHRVNFLTSRKTAVWNYFDLVVVVAQIAEEAIAVAASSSGVDMAKFRLLRVLRILRLVRILRVVRVLHLIAELRTILSSIMGSFKSLAWTVVLLSLIIYIVGVYFTQTIADHLVGKDEEDFDKGEQELRYYFGSLARALLSLWQAMSGGADWDSMAGPLIAVHPLLAAAFAAYVAFALLALMNVVTGVFVQTALQNAKEEEDLFLTDQIMKLFEISNREQRKTITLEEINARLCNPEAAGEWKSINVQAEEAKYLFELLDIDETGEIGFEEFLSGCLRLHGCAKSFDLLTVMQEARSMMRTWHIQYQQFQGSLDAIMRQVVMSASANAVLKSSLDHLMDLTSGHQDGLSHLERRLQSLERSVSTVRRALWSMDNLQSLLDALASPNGEGAAPGDHAPGDVLV